MEQPRIRIICVDDHPLFREGIATVIGHQADMEVVGMASTAAEAVQQFRLHQPDVTLMDLRLPDRSGVTAVSEIRASWPKARIIMLTTFEGDVEIHRALEAGARGYVLKSTPLAELIDIIRRVHEGRRHLPTHLAQSLAEHATDDALTARELEVLMLLAEGDRNRDIAARLQIADDTVKAHISQIIEKLGANGRTQAVTMAIRRGIIRM